MTKACSELVGHYFCVSKIGVERSSTNGKGDLRLPKPPTFDHYSRSFDVSQLSQHVIESRKSLSVDSLTMSCSMVRFGT